MVSCLRSIITFNLLVSGIQTYVEWIIRLENDQVIARPERIFYEADEEADYCVCNDYATCYAPSRVYNVTSYDNDVYLTYSLLESNIILTLKNWFTGCWAVESLLRSSFSR